jgi:TolA-binding protein
MSDHGWKRHIVTPQLDEEAFVQRVLDDARVRRRAPWRVLAVAAALVTLVGGAVLFSFRATPLTAGPTFRAGPAALTVTLADRSVLTLEASGEAQLLSASPTEVVVQVLSGRASFSVFHDPRRSFRVVAGATEVVVRGTRFAVERVGASASVVVEEGTVEVRENGRWVAKLEASQRYPPASGGDDVTVEESPSPPPGPRAAPSPSKVRPTRASTPKPQPQAPPVLPAEVAPPPDAERLFEDARVERGLGHFAEAASLLEQLLARYPGSAQEGLAAFELARLRMDQLEAFESAIAPLKLAVSRLPSAPLREDAAARLVQLYGKLGQIQSCAAARSEYLLRFPRGIHRPSVELLCPPGSP